MKKSLFTTLIIFHLVAFIFARDASDCTFTFEPSFGFMNGTIVENVWYVNEQKTQTTTTYTPTQKQSRLDWQLQNAPYFGMNVDMTFPKKVFFNFDFNTVFSGEFGIMEDYDWLNPIKWPKDPSDELTNYSIHTNRINQVTQIKVLLGYGFEFDTDFPWKLLPGFGFMVQSCSFEGFGGYKTYKQDNWVKYNFADITVISYKQNSVAPIVDLKAYIDFDYFDTSINLFTAYIKKLDCVDRHELRSQFFNDRIADVWIFGGTIKAMYKLDSTNKIGLKASVQFSPDAYGFTYSSKTSTKPSSGSLGGSSKFLWTYSIVYAFCL